MVRPSALTSEEEDKKAQWARDTRKKRGRRGKSLLPLSPSWKNHLWADDEKGGKVFSPIHSIFPQLVSAANNRGFREAAAGINSSLCPT